MQVTRCGKNLWNFELAPSGNSWAIPFLPQGNYVLSMLNVADWWTENANGKNWYLRNAENTAETATVSFVNTVVGERAYAALSVPYSGEFRLNTFIANVSSHIQDIQLEAGSIATAYAPYTGSAAMLTLPETIYGGELDAVTGEGSEEWSSVNLSSSNILGILEDYANETTMLYYVVSLNNMQDATLVCCSHLPTANIVNSINTNIGIIGNPTGSMAYIRLSKETASNLDEFRQWVDAQYAAGTPVTIAYKLATPTTFQATGGQSLPALPSTNTIYTDADTVTVSGLSDPIATIASLQSRVSALESAQTNM